MSDPAGGHFSDELLQEYLDAEVHEAQRVRIDEHVSGCSRCRARLGEFRRLFVTIESYPEVALEKDLAPAVVQAIAGARLRRRVVRFGLPAAEVTAAIGLALAARRFIEIGLEALRSGLLVLLARLALPEGSHLLPIAIAWPGWVRGLRWELLDVRSVNLSALWTPAVLGVGAVVWITGNWLLLRRQGAGNRHAG
jgi:predicted anti-sigma-YlaC factor YlaD